MTLDDKLHGTSWGTFGFGGMTILESFYATGIVQADESRRNETLTKLESVFKNLKDVPEQKFYQDR